LEAAALGIGCVGDRLRWEWGEAGRDKRGLVAVGNLTGKGEIDIFRGFREYPELAVRKRLGDRLK
jgi:hypothetical protein